MIIKPESKNRVQYLGKTIRKILTGKGFACPSCGVQDSKLVERKYILTSLRRCNGCQLLFRSPTTTPDENYSFYQDSYSQGFTTDLPTQDVLEKLLSTGFKASEKDYSQYLNVLAAVGCNPGDLLFDFGCSWGYGSWQFMQAGYDVKAYDISVQRSKYARKYLGINVQTTLDDAIGPYDIFFSAHVLEHVPSVLNSIAFAKNNLKHDGWFVAFTPNGSNPFRYNHHKSWRYSWGMVHPNLLDDVFYSNVFKTDLYLLASPPYDINAIKQWAYLQRASEILDLSGNELLVIAKLASTKN